MRSHSRDYDITRIDEILDHRIAAHCVRKALIEGAHCVLPAMHVLRPTLGGAEDDVVVPQTNKRIFHSPRFQYSKSFRTSSTFSSDIAYSDGPAASRAPSGVTCKASSEFRTSSTFFDMTCVVSRLTTCTARPLLG